MDEKKTFKIDTSIFTEDGTQVSEVSVVEDDADLGEIIDVDELSSDDKNIEKLNNTSITSKKQRDITSADDVGRIDLDDIDDSGDFELDGELIHVDIGEREYDPSKGSWTDSAPKDVEAEFIDCTDQATAGDRKSDQMLLSESIMEDQEKDGGWKDGPQDKDYLFPNSSDGDITEEDPSEENSFEIEEKKEDKKLPWPLQVVYGLIALAALGFCFFYPYQFMQDYLAATTEQSTEKQMTDATDQVENGTYCTIKSNSLDGIPVFEHAGDKFQIGVVPEGKYVQLKNSSVVEGEKWASIDYCGLKAWVPMKRLIFISNDEDYIKKGSTIYMNAETEFGIKAYEKPSSDSSVVAENITYGTEFTVKKLFDGWAEVECDGKSCWVNMYLMGSYGTKNWKVKTLTDSGEIHLRSEPSQDSKSLCKIPEDTKLTMQEFDHGWGKVEYKENTGWVKLHYLIPTGE